MSATAPFHDKLVVLTGAASGIGRELAVALAGQGARLSLWDVNAAALEAVAEDCRAKGAVTVDTRVIDVRSRAATEEAARALGGAADLVIANAGLGGVNPGEDFDVEVDERIMTVNYFGTVHTVMPFVQGMVKRRAGHIVGVASMASHRGLPGAASYCASKAAQVKFLESLRLDLASHGVRVTTILPGFVRTAMTKHDEFTMPFMVDAEDAARLILRAVSRRKRVYSFPWPMKLLSFVNAIMPAFIYDRLLPALNRPKKARRAKVF